MQERNSELLHLLCASIAVGLSMNISHHLTLHQLGKSEVLPVYVITGRLYVPVKTPASKQ
jgi:hypothetical protein